MPKQEEKQGEATSSTLHFASCLVSKETAAVDNDDDGDSNDDGDWLDDGDGLDDGDELCCDAVIYI